MAPRTTLVTLVALTATFLALAALRSQPFRPLSYTTSVAPE